MFKNALKFLFILFCQNALGQSVLLAELNDRTGLPQNSVKGMAFDKLGYLWIGTENGLARYDGQSIKTFFFKELKSNRIFLIINNIYTDEILAYTSRFEKIVIKNGVVSLKTKLNFRDSLLRLALKDVKDISNCYQIYPKNNISFCLSINESFENNYLIKNGENLKVFKANKNELVFIMHDTVFTMNSMREIQKYTPIPNSKKVVNKYEEIKLLSSFNSTDEVFFTQKNKLYIIQYLGGPPQIKLLLDDLPSDAVWTSCIYDAQKEILCLGSYTKGLKIFKLNPAFRSHEITQGVPINAHLVMDSSCVYTKGQFWSNKGIFPIKRDGNAKFYEYAVLKDHFGDVLSPDNKGLYRITFKKHSVSETQLLHATAIEVLMEDRQNRLWVCERDKAVKIYSNQDRALLKPLLILNKFRNVKLVAEDTMTNTFWLLQEFHQLYQLNKQFVCVDSIILSSNHSVRSLHIAKDGQLWITTYGNGFYKYKHGRLISLPLDKNGSLKYSHCILEDKENNYWISTNKGLFKMNYEQLNHYDPQKAPKAPDYLYFNFLDGLVSNEFNGGAIPSAIKVNENFFSYPTMGGLVWFDPLKTNVQYVKQGILIDGVILDGKSYPVADTLRIANNIHRLLFNTSIAYWGNRENLIVEYRLLGFETEWQQMPKDYNVNFTDLPSGNYLLEFRVRDLNLKSKYYYSSIYFIVDKKYYETWWFISFLILFLIIAFFLILRLRTARLLKKNRLLEMEIDKRSSELRQKNEVLMQQQLELNNSLIFKDKVLSMFSHNIIGPIKYISVISDALENNLVKQDSNYISNITVTSKNLLLQSVELLNWLNTQKNNYKVIYETVNIHTLVEDKCVVFRPIAMHKGVLIEN